MPGLVTVRTKAANEADTMNITDISGIGDATARRLKAHGIESVEHVARASIEQLAAVPGIGENRAAALRESARGLRPDVAAGEESPEATPVPAGDDAGTDGRKDGNGKKGKRKKEGKTGRKKGKGKDKKKKKGKDKKKGKKGKGRKKKKNKRQ